MSDIVPADERLRAELLRVEERRRAALLAVDVPALSELLDPSLLHVHAPGLVHTRTQLLEHVATRQAYLDIARGELDIRVVGDVAIMTGRIVNRLRNPDGSERVLGGVATQVLVRGDDTCWRYVSFQMTPDGERVWPDLPGEQTANSGEDQPT